MADELDASLFLEACPVGVLFVAEDGKILRVNAELERMLGYAREELVGSTTDRLIAPKDQKRHAAQFRLFFAKPERRGFGAGLEICAQRKDRSEIMLDVALSPVTGVLESYLLVLVVDISERREREAEHARRREELERSNLELEQFASIASHDMREPLRMIISYTDLLAEQFEGKLDARTQKFMGYISEGGKRMQRLIDDLLAYSRLDSRAQSAVPVRAEDAIRDVLQDMRPLVQETGTQVTYDALPTLLVDPVQLDQLLSNVINNAIKFRRDEKPRVHIHADFVQGMWRFSVQDNGIGLDTKYAQRIFQMFQRLNERAKYDGSGIGLAVAKKIVERAGGKIWVESNLGHGATFYFTLPGLAETRRS